MPGTSGEQGRKRKEITLLASPKNRVKGQYGIKVMRDTPVITRNLVKRLKVTLTGLYSPKKRTKRKIIHFLLEIESCNANSC